MKYKIAAATIVIAVASAGIWWTNRPAPVAAQTSATTAMVEVTLPDALSFMAEVGKTKFDANCAQCHGANAAGQLGVAPPLVHIVYEPNHHGDESFQRAVAMGVRAHHWPFGNMPAVDGLNRDDVATIIAYIRELQRANGIN